MEHNHIVRVSAARGIVLVLHIVNRGRADGQIGATHAIDDGRLRVLVINQWRIEVVLARSADRRLVGDDVIARAVADEVAGVAGSE